MGSMTGRSALVTGGAQGIGHATALALAAEGVSICVLDTNAEGAEKAAAEIRDSGAGAVACPGDVADEDAVRAAVAMAEREFGRLDILINNAAEFRAEYDLQDRDAVSTRPEVWDRIMDVNLRGAWLAARHAIPAMVRAGGGSIVNVSTTAALKGDTTHVAYAASKAGMHSLARSIATTHGRYGVRANTIAAGLVLSPTARVNVKPEMLRVYQEHILLPYVAEPEDIASIATFLCSDGARWITGSVLVADGGFDAHQPWLPQAAVVHPGSVPAPVEVPSAG